MMRWLVLLALFVDARPADACAAAPPHGAYVRIAEEEALIVWDPATKTEHFIRRAAFYSTARSFGFLVPTPTVPQLSEVPDYIFQTLANAIRPEIKLETKKKYRLGAWLVESCLLMKRASKTAAVGASQDRVRVLQTANVAGFDATTVEADDATALTKWLGDHGFEATPQLTAWLERYVQDKWKMTAFVVSSDAKEGDNRYEVATRAVKMTFPAERPFYPYREPKIEMTVETDAKLAPPISHRMLRVFFVSNERYAATLAEAPWSAKVLQAAPLTVVSPDLTAITGAQNFMTVFVDTSSPRQGIEELYFAPSADKSPVKQPPEIVEHDDVTIIPLDLILLTALVVGYIVRRRRRRR